MKVFISKLHYKKNLSWYESCLYVILGVCEFFYSIVISLKNFFYDKNIIHPFQVEKKGVFKNLTIISIGNLTTGGTGKTPVTKALYDYFDNLNKTVCIISRGYGSKLDTNKVNIISLGLLGDGKLYFENGNLCGDEVYWLSEKCPNAIVLTCKNRKNAVEYLKKVGKNIDIILLDDCFQNRKINKDFDFVLIDSEKKLGNEKLLPQGPLREPAKSLKNRASKIILVNKFNENFEDIQLYKQKLEKSYGKKVIVCNVNVKEIVNFHSGEIIQIEELVQKKSIAFCAIGQPNQFYKYLKNFSIQATKDFSDHHLYQQKDIQNIQQLMHKYHAKIAFTTEKDAVKLKELKIDFEICIVKLDLKLDFDQLF